MKITGTHVTIGVAVVAASFWFAALSSEVSINTERGLEAEIRYLVNLKADWMVKFPEPRPLEIQKQMLLWDTDIVKYQHQLAAKRNK